MNYLSEVPFQWKITYGKGANIGIIDAGFDVNNIYIKKNIKQYKDLGGTNIRHGTHVMGIMCLETSKVNVVHGYAPKSQYYIVSVPIGQSNVDQLLCDALQWLKQFDIDVINMSFSCFYQNQKFRDLLLQFHNKNTILVAAYSTDYIYPHIYPFVISAGKDLVVKNHFISTVSNNEFDDIKGTSMQSAFITSIVADAKSYNKKINKDQFIKRVSGQTMYDDSQKSQLMQFSIKI